MLDQPAAERAILHLSALGDTDIFPPPFEFSSYMEEKDEVSAIIAKMDTSQYKPKSCFESLSPKNRLSFRIAHQLYPADTLLYTTAVIQIAQSIEDLRLDAKVGPFSYRFISKPDEPRIFSDSSNYHDWLTHIREMYGEVDPFSDVKYVIETDISDFYSRIYFHRLEHVLDDCNAPNAVRKIIEGIIKFSRAWQSYGLPVGTAASRILAEGLLNDTDSMIVQRASAYSRYVDDFRIVLNHQHEVHATLCRLAEHLMLTEGLSLNASKTRTYTTDQAVQTLDARLSDIFNDDELVRLNRYIRAVYEDEDVSVEDIEDVDPTELSNKLIDILRRESVDYASVKVILKALRAVRYPDPMVLVEATAELLYFTPRDYCILIGAMAQRTPDVAPALAQFIVSLLQKSPFSEMALSRIWVAHLFVTQALPIDMGLLDRLNLQGSVIERRQHLLLRGLLRDRGFFREQKTRFDEASDWEKPALMFAASCMSRGEYKIWLDTIKDHLYDPFSNAYRKWLEVNQNDLFDKLKTQFVVKSREAIQLEKFQALFDDDDDDLPLDALKPPPPF